MDKASLPIFAAIGGVVFPALVFLYFNYSDPIFVQGWAIPAATDIAFALGILALVGSRAPVSLKILLLAVAIIDDLVAIIIIALFYTQDLSLVALAYGGLGALGIALGLFLGKQIGVFCLSWIAVKLGLAKLPTGATWPQVYGIACLTGVGFTMSLFIGTLAFEGDETLNAVRLGVLMGSIASGVLGFTLLRLFCKAPEGKNLEGESPTKA